MTSQSSQSRRSDQFGVKTWLYISIRNTLAQCSSIHYPVSHRSVSCWMLEDLTSWPPQLARILLMDCPARLCFTDLTRTLGWILQHNLTTLTLFQNYLISSFVKLDDRSCHINLSQACKVKILFFYSAEK